jgi:hypothetical protein
VEIRPLERRIGGGGWVCGRPMPPGCLDAMFAALVPGAAVDLRRGLWVAGSVARSGEGRAARWTRGGPDCREGAGRTGVGALVDQATGADVPDALFGRQPVPTACGTERSRDAKAAAGIRGQKYSCSSAARPTSTDAVVVGATRTASKVRPRRQVARRRRQGNRRPPGGRLLRRKLQECVAGVQPAGAPAAAGSWPLSRLTVTDAAYRRGSGVE